MKRKWICVLAVLMLMIFMAVPAAAMENPAQHIAAHTVGYGYAEEPGGSLLPVLVGMGLSGVICLGLVSLQKDVHKKSGASDYITEEGIRIVHASDRFTHTTQTRRRLQNNQNRRR